MPPRVHSAPGSTGKNKPVPRRWLLSCWRVTPACTVTSMSPGRTSSTLFIRLTSRLTPPYGALTCPSSEVPPPKGMIGVLCRAHALTIAATSSVDSAKHTASGATAAWYDSPTPCWSRTACEVENHWPSIALNSSARAGGRPDDPLGRDGDSYGDSTTAVCVAVI